MAVGYLIVVILLLTGGEILRRTATFEDALSSTQEHLTTQNPADTPAQDDERAAPLAASLPWVGPSIRADLRRQHAIAAYWRGDYAALTGADPLARRSSQSEVGSGPQNGQTSDRQEQLSDGATRFIEVNAMFRDLARQSGNSKALMQGLDAVLKAYISVLEVDPNAVDAAYNYEFASRVRGALAAGRVNSIKLPTNSNMNGEKGSPPPQTKPTEFNIIVPLRPEERQEQVDPGASGPPQRKG
jgi:hypothetical protein